MVGHGANVHIVTGPVDEDTKEFEAVRAHTEVDMTATVMPTVSQPWPERPRPASARRGLSLHGTEGADDHPVTWHVTPLVDDGAPDTYLVERAEGDIHNPAVWMQAQREASTVGEDEVIALVRRVMFKG